MRKFRDDPTQFPVLALPVELSKKVYAEVFRGAIVQFSTKKLSRQTLSLTKLPPNTHLNVVRYTNHRNLLMASKVVFNQAIDEYWKAVFVLISRTGHLADFLPVQLRAHSITRIRKLRLRGPLCFAGIEYMTENLPNLRKLDLTASNHFVLQWTPRLPVPQPFDSNHALWSAFSQRCFPELTKVFAKFPRLQVTARVSVTVHDRNVVHNTSSFSESEPDVSSFLGSILRHLVKLTYWQVVVDFEFQAGQSPKVTKLVVKPCPSDD